LLTNGLYGPSHFSEEIPFTLDEDAPRVSFPCVSDPRVDRDCLGGRFGAHVVRMVVAVLERGGPKMDDRLITRELGLGGDPESHARGRDSAWPIRQSIESAAITERHSRASFGTHHPLQCTLRVEDRVLRGASSRLGIVPWETTSEENRRRLGKNDDVLAERAPDDLEHGRLASPGASRENHETAVMSQLSARAAHDGY
jgi:hypothetical protein